MAAMIEVYVGTDAFGHAEAKARYGHHHWIVWKIADGNLCAARLSKESLATALNEAVYVPVRGENQPRLWCCWKSQKTFTIVRQRLAEMWLRNMEAGTFPY